MKCFAILCFMMMIISQANAVVIVWSVNMSAICASTGGSVSQVTDVQSCVADKAPVNVPDNCGNVESTYNCLPQKCPASSKALCEQQIEEVQNLATLANLSCTISATCGAITGFQRATALVMLIAAFFYL